MAMKAFAPSLSTDSAQALVTSLGQTYEEISKGLGDLEQEIQEAGAMDNMQEAADYCHKTLLSTMDKLRQAADEAETKIPEEELPYPTYDALLFSV